MKVFIAAAVAITLSGCASMQRPQMNIMSHAKPVSAPLAVNPSSEKPATFKQRFKTFTGKLKWTHRK